MSIVISLPKRSGQSSPISISQWDEAMFAIEQAFLSVGAGTGSVTSVGLTAASIFTVTGSPITTTGTIDISLNTQVANRIFAGPTSGGDAAPAFRSLVIADIPTITPAKGGTGNTGFTSGRLIVSTATDVLGVSSVTAIEAGYLSGVTSAIQTQLNSKQNTITVLGINNGGTGGNTAQTARASLLPSYTGNTGKFLRVNAGETDVEWATITGAIPTINSLSGALIITQGTTGTDFAVSSSGTTITINLPSASATNRGAVTTGAQTIAGVKTFTSNPIINASTVGQVFYSGASRDLVGDSTFTYDGATMTVPNIRQTTCTRIASTSSLEAFDKYVILDQSSAIDVTLPTADVSLVGQTYVLKDIDGACATYNVTIKVASGDYLEGTINGTYVMSVNFEAIQITLLEVAASTYEWFITARYKVG